MKMFKGMYELNKEFALTPKNLKNALEWVNTFYKKELDQDYIRLWIDARNDLFCFNLAGHPSNIEPHFTSIDIQKRQGFIMDELVQALQAKLRYLNKEKNTLLSTGDFSDNNEDGYSESDLNLMRLENRIDDTEKDIEVLKELYSEHNRKD